MGRRRKRGREEGEEGRREGGGRKAGKGAAEWRTDGDKEMKRIERELVLPAA